MGPANPLNGSSNMAVWRPVLTKGRRRNPVSKMSKQSLSLLVKVRRTPLRETTSQLLHSTVRHPKVCYSISLHSEASKGMFFHLRNENVHRCLHEIWAWLLACLTPLIDFVEGQCCYEIDWKPWIRRFYIFFKCIFAPYLISDCWRFGYFLYRWNLKMNLEITWIFILPSLI